MRYAIILVSMLLAPVWPASAHVSVGIGFPNVSIGINLPVYPRFARVPDYPVYYAPQVGFNLFFYDGMYWVYQGDHWYASSWYNGPWALVAPQYVPVYILRVPVRYYRAPPPYFRGWRMDAPPRWGERYGERWEHERHDWDRWSPRGAPAPAPLPSYQQRYTGDRYPRVEQQPMIRSQNYRYQPGEPVVRQHYEREAEYARQNSPPHSPYGPPSNPPGKGQGKHPKGGEGRDD